MNIDFIVAAESHYKAKMDEDEGLADSPNVTPRAKPDIRQTLFSEQSLMNSFAQMLKSELHPMKNNVHEIMVWWIGTW